MWNGKNVLITGAGRGLGREMARAFGEAGYNVGVHYNSSEEGAISVCKDIESYGQKALLIKGDISDYDTLKRIFSVFILEFEHIDVMINNSGISQYMSIRESSLEHFNLLNNVDWRGTFFGTQFAANHMVEKGIHGSIINFSSCQKEMNLPNAAVYSSVKAAIYKFTQQAALEYAPYKIRINSISPGMIKVLPPEVVLPREIAQRQRVPWQRVGKPSDVSHVALFLADEASDYITGTDIRVDGGLPLPAVMDNWRDPLPAPLAANLPSK